MWPAAPPDLQRSLFKIQLRTCHPESLSFFCSTAISALSRAPFNFQGPAPLLTCTPNQVNLAKKDHTIECFEFALARISKDGGSVKPARGSRHKHAFGKAEQLREFVCRQRCVDPLFANPLDFVSLFASFDQSDRSWRWRRILRLRPRAADSAQSPFRTRLAARQSSFLSITHSSQRAAFRGGIHGNGTHRQLVFHRPGYSLGAFPARGARHRAALQRSWSAHSSGWLLVSLPPGHGLGHRDLRISGLALFLFASPEIR